MWRSEARIESIVCSSRSISDVEPALICASYLSSLGGSDGWVGSTERALAASSAARPFAGTARCVG